MDPTAMITKPKPSPTTNNTPHIEDLLCYLPAYKVLICRTCHFAIQPSALSSHLLRHGFYRSNRKKVTKNLERLDLAEPDDVSFPEAEGDAIGELPVHEGFVCEFDEGGGGGCGHACLAEKRMTAHWREVHGRHHVSEVRCRRGRLQTFFRGSKMRYFEVERGRVGGSGNGRVEGVGGGGGGGATKFYETVSRDDSGEAETTTSKIALLPDLRLEELGLLHYWHVRTGQTLNRGQGEKRDHWTGVVTSLAVESEFLMRSILAITAVHSAYLGIRSGAGKDEIWRHHSTALTHHCSALAGFRKALEGGITPGNATTFAASARLLGLAFAAGVVAGRWLIEHSMNANSPQELFDRSVLGPLEFLLLVRGSVEIQLEAQASFEEGSPFKFPSYIVDAFDTSSPISQTGGIDARLSACVQATERVQRSTTDLYALESAIEALSFCYTWGASSRHSRVDDYTLWVHAHTWPRLISESYVQLLHYEDPAALIVYAHWCLLVKKVERFSWFLEGISERLIEGIEGTLRRVDHEAGDVLVDVLEETRGVL